MPPPILIQLTFTSHTGSLLLSSLKKVTSPLRPPPLVPRPLLGTAAGIGKTVETFLCIYAVLYCEKVTLYPHFRDNLRGKVVDNLDNKVGDNFHYPQRFSTVKMKNSGKSVLFPLFSVDNYVDNVDISPFAVDMHPSMQCIHPQRWISAQMPPVFPICGKEREYSCIYDAYSRDAAHRLVGKRWG